MRILQVITLSELGGAQTVVANLANQLCKSHEVAVVAGEGDGKLWDILDPAVDRMPCRHLQRAISPFHDLRAAVQLRKIYRHYRPDVIHLHSSKAGVLGRLVFPSKRIIYTVHGFDSVRVAFRRFLPVEKLMQHFCKAIVGVSDYDRRNLISEGIDQNVSVVHNGISRPDISRTEEIDLFGRYERIILCIARVFPQKKPYIFVEAARRLPQYGFIWIGNQRPVTEFDLPANCHFIGNKLNAGAYCSKADLFILPSNYEGLPMVIIEAMSFGKPVVASDVGGISEIVRNGENGFVLENDPQLFADKIAAILSDREMYERFCVRSLQLYEEQLTVDQMVDGYMKLYTAPVR